MADYDDEYDVDLEEIACGQDIIDWWSYADDGYRFTADAADSETAEQERWVVAQCFRRGDEYAYEPLTDEMTLAEAQEYMAGEDSELAALIAQAEGTDDFQARERLIDEIGPLVRQQIKAALQPDQNQPPHGGSA